MMYVKVMGSQDLGDKDQSKNYSLYECNSVKFCIQPQRGPVALINNDAGNEKTIDVPGNVYVLNQDGTTIDCWAPNSKGPVKHLLTEGVDPALLKKQVWVLGNRTPRNRGMVIA